MLANFTATPISVVDDELQERSAVEAAQNIEICIILIKYKS